MGIQDRDYMKRPRDHDHARGTSTHDQLEGFARAWLARHPRALRHLALGIVLLVIVAFFFARFAG